MKTVIDALAVLGSIFIFANFFDIFPNDILRDIGFFIFGVMNIFNAKRHSDIGEKRRAKIIIVCALVLFCVSIWGIMSGPLLRIKN